MRRLALVGFALIVVALLLLLPVFAAATMVAGPSSAASFQAALAAAQAGTAPGQPCVPGPGVPPTGGGESGPVLAAKATQAAGWTGDDWRTAIMIVGAESTFNPTVDGPVVRGRDHDGLFQISSVHTALIAKHGGDRKDPYANARMAFELWESVGREWSPTWEAYTNGGHLKFADEADAAIQVVQIGTAAQEAPCAGPGAPGTPVLIAGAATAPCPVMGKMNEYGAVNATISDPTNTGGCITPGMANLLAAFEGSWPDWPWGTRCWDRHAQNTKSNHRLGKGCDITVGRIGSHPSEADKARGWELAEWGRAHHEEIGLATIIWQGRIWSASRDSQGWRAYGGGGVYSATSVTGGHFDHHHWDSKT